MDNIPKDFAEKFNSMEYSQPFKPSLPKASHRDVLTAFAVFAGIFLFAFFSMPYLADYGLYLGGYIKSVSLCVIFSLCFLYVKGERKRPDARTLFYSFCCVAVILPYFFENSNQVFSIPLLIYLLGALCVSRTGILNEKRDSYHYVIAEVKDVFLIPLNHMFLPLRSILKSIRFKSNKKLNGIVLGVVLSLPVIFVLFGLLVSGDAAFSNVTSGFLDKIISALDKLIKLLDTNFDLVFFSVGAAFLTLIFAPPVFSALFCFRHSIQKEIKNNSPKKNSEAARPLPENIATGFFVTVCTLYVLYLFTQLSYLFGAFSGEIPLAVDMSLSEYARQGFFEMSTISCINLGLIATGAIFVKRKESGRISPLFKGIFTFICIFTMLMIITAVSKMALYITEMGLTHLRILVCIIDFLLLVTLGCVLIKLYKNKFPYMKIIVSVCCAVLSLYCLFGDSALIASYNTNAYLKGRHAELDVYTIHIETDEYHEIKSLHKTALNSDEKTSLAAKYWIGNRLLYSSNYSLEGKFSMTTAENFFTSSSLSNFLFWEYARKNEDFAAECLKIYRFSDYNYYEDSYYYDGEMDAYE